MQDAKATGSEAGRVDAEAVVDAFAAFLQVGFLYPANNPRVSDACAALTAALLAFAPDGAAVEILATRDGLELGTQRFDRSRPDVSWTRDRLVRARIAAIRLDPDLDPQALVELAVALRRSFPPNAPPFAQLWCHGGRGVEPISATAAAAPTAAAPQAAAPVAKPAPAPQAPAAATKLHAARPPHANTVLAALARSRPTREALGRIHRRFEEEYDGGAHFDAAGTLELLVAQLPEALRSDTAAACSHVDGVLEQVYSQLEGFLLARPDDPGRRLSEFALALLRRRTGDAGTTPARPAPAARPAPRAPTSEPPPPPAAAAPVSRTPVRRPDVASQGLAAGTPQAPRIAVPPALASLVGKPIARDAAPADADSFEGFLSGLRDDLSESGHRPANRSIERRARDIIDSSVKDDLPALLVELGELQAGPEFDPELEPALLDDEVLGTCMHLLARGRDSRIVTDGIVRLTDHLMGDPSPRHRRILGSYLRLAREGGLAHDTDARERLVSYLQRNGVQHLLSTRETLDVEQVARTFPTQLVLFLDALELKDPASDRAFKQLLDLVGDDAMIAATSVLIEDGTLLTPNRTEKVLKFGGIRAARIAKNFVRSGANWTRAQVVNYLRRQGLGRQESAALAIVQPVTSLPTAYLADLCECVASGQSSAKQHGYTSLLLRQYVRDTAERPGDLDRRLYAIRALGHWPTPETIQYLEHLAKDGRLLQQSKEARAIRQAASEALQQIQGMGAPPS